MIPRLRRICHTRHSMKRAIPSRCIYTQHGRQRTAPLQNTAVYTGLTGTYTKPVVPPISARHTHQEYECISRNCTVLVYSNLRIADRGVCVRHTFHTTDLSPVAIAGMCVWGCRPTTHLCVVIRYCLPILAKLKTGRKDNPTATGTKLTRNTTACSPLPHTNPRKIP